jgi:putative transposase
MREYFFLFLRFMASFFKSKAILQAENLALRHQLCVLHRSTKRAKIRPADRVLWSVLAQVWSDWKDALVFVKPDTVIRWQRKRFKQHWTKLSRSGEPGRPKISEEVRELISTMSCMNPTWGSPHIVGELAKLGISVWPSTVKKYMVKADKPPSQTWRAFLKNHASEIVSIDFLVVPTVRFKMLYVLVFLLIERRRVIHFNVTAHPTVEWTAQQVVEAFPWDTAPKYLLRDRDAIYGSWFRGRVTGMGIKEVLTAPRSPWQNPYSERLNGSIRRECVDRLIVFGQGHLERMLKSYFEYYNQHRTHLSLEMDSPAGRPAQGPEQGKVVSIPPYTGRLLFGYIAVIYRCTSLISSPHFVQ